MTYKEKKLKEFEEFCLDKGVLFTDRKMMAGFLYETIDEILGCLPECEKYFDYEGSDIKTGWDLCHDEFLHSLEKKAGGV